MLFNSYEFILLYLPITLIVYYQLAKRISNNAAKNFLVIASLCFYSYWDIRNLPVLLTSILVNYIFGHLLSDKKSKTILTAGIVFNLLFLGYFKYTDFIIQNLNNLIGTTLELKSIILPLGVSFFTFTQTAYLVDVYRGETKEYTKSDYLLFVTIFPHLIAGPILYHKDMIPQFSVSDNYRINYKNLTYGIVWFTIGLFKKVVIADKLAAWANLIFNEGTVLTMLDAWGGSFAYTFQLYFDFSGYSEMAVGLGLMLNYNLPINFRSPYKATSIIDFWRRWHITLSSFLKNYLYIPLGGNRSGNHMRNILITMFLGGLWHGAGWTFIFWGMLHGVFICINHLWRKTKLHLPNMISWLLTINAVNIAWIFFRAESFNVAVQIIRAMFSFKDFYIPYSKHLENLPEGFLPVGYDNVINLSILGAIFGFGILCCKFYDTNDIVEKFKANYYSLLALIVMAVYAISRFTKASEFIYFQF